MADCFITRRGYGSSGGGSTTIVTPEKLGYVSDAILFFDGRYNSPTAHISNGSYWIDLVSNSMISRKVNGGADLIGEEYYIKQSGANTSLLIPDNLTYDNFTIDLFLEITGGTTAENDILANFNSSGFGILTENGELKANIYSTSTHYLYTDGFSYAQNTKYLATVTYDGQVYSFYVDGVLIGIVELSNNYRKPLVSTYLGCSGTGGDANGSYNFYRLGIYDRALTAAEVLQNYNRDKYRYVDGNTDDIGSGDVPTPVSNVRSVIASATEYTGSDYPTVVKTFDEIKSEISTFLGVSSETVSGADCYYFNSSKKLGWGFTSGYMYIVLNGSVGQQVRFVTGGAGGLTLHYKDTNTFVFSDDRGFYFITRDESGGFMSAWHYLGEEAYVFTEDSLSAYPTTNTTIYNYGFGTGFVTTMLAPMINPDTNKVIPYLYLVPLVGGTHSTSYFIQDADNNIYKVLVYNSKQMFAVKVST